MPRALNRLTILGYLFTFLFPNEDFLVLTANQAQLWGITTIIIPKHLKKCNIIITLCIIASTQQALDVQKTDLNFIYSYYIQKIMHIRKNKLYGSKVQMG